jgi:hypothetical protein
MVADAAIGKFCAVAANVRIGPPNHPMDRPSLHRFTYIARNTIPRALSAIMVSLHAAALTWSRSGTMSGSGMARSCCPA